MNWQKEGDVDGGQVALAKTLTINQLRQDIYVPIEYTVHFHVQVDGRC